MRLIRLLVAASTIVALTAVAAPRADAADPEITCTKSGSSLTIGLQAGTPAVQLFRASTGDIGVALADNWVLYCYDSHFKPYTDGSLSSIVVTEAPDSSPTTWSLRDTDWRPTITFDLDPADRLLLGATSDVPQPQVIQAAPGGAAGLSFDQDPRSAELVLSAVPQSTYIQLPGPNDDVVDLSDDAATYPGSTTIDAGSGADRVVGGSGDDTVLLGDDGSADVARGGGGSDQVRFSSASWTVGALVDPSAPGGDGVDRLDDVSDFEEYVGTDGPDRFVAPPTGMTAVGGGGNDVFVSGPGDDTFYGRTTTNLVPWDLDEVDWSGAAGAVTVTSDAFGSDVAVGDGHDRLFAISSLVGSAYDDHFFDPQVYWVRPGPGDDVLTSDWTAATYLIAEPGFDGNDTATGPGGVIWDYSARTGALSLTADGVANDGLPGELDDIVPVPDLGIWGGAGADVIRGSAYGDHILGGPGNDRIFGGAGNDALDGGAGDDVFDLGAAPDGSDTVDGGPGIDQVSYARRATPVYADLDGAADDGASGERDNLRYGIEIVIGGRAGDRLTGSALAERLDGGPGDDVLSGGGGADLLNGAGGDDRFYARDGVKDVIDGGSGRDRARRDPVDVLRSVEGSL